MCGWSARVFYVFLTRRTGMFTSGVRCKKIEKKPRRTCCAPLDAPLFSFVAHHIRCRCAFYDTYLLCREGKRAGAETEGPSSRRTSDRGRAPSPQQRATKRAPDGDDATRPRRFQANERVPIAPRERQHRGRRRSRRPAAPRAATGEGREAPR